MSQARSCNALRIASPVSTRSKETSYPPLRKILTIICASNSESSTINARSGTFIEGGPAGKAFASETSPRICPTRYRKTRFWPANLLWSEEFSPKMHLRTERFVNLDQTAGVLLSKIFWDQDGRSALF